MRSLRKIDFWIKALLMASVYALAALCIYDALKGFQGLSSFWACVLAFIWEMAAVAQTLPYFVRGLRDAYNEGL